MKKLSKSMMIITFFVAIISCADKKQSTNGIIHLDVSKSYPEKIITIEDIADVEYVQMEVHDDYLFGAIPKYISSSTIVINDYSTHDFLFFTGDGKPKSKFNSYGQGPGEYTFVSIIVYDEVEDKLFVLSRNKILVYSSDGDFYHSLSLPGNVQINRMVNYDKESLLIHNGNDAYNSNFVRISKKDASVIEEISIAGHKDIELLARPETGENTIIFIAVTYNIVRYKDGFLLSDNSKDTVFYHERNNELSPVLVRTPPIFEMNPYVYVNSFVEAGDYLFLRRTTVKFDKNARGMMPSNALMINKNDQSVYKQKILLKDYADKEIELCPEIISFSANSGIGFVSLRLAELKEANKENKLSGRLKEMVEASNDDSNDIFMILYFK